MKKSELMRILTKSLEILLLWLMLLKLGVFTYYYNYCVVVYHLLILKSTEKRNMYINKLQIMSIM